MIISPEITLYNIPFNVIVCLSKGAKPVEPTEITDEVFYPDIECVFPSF